VSTPVAHRKSAVRPAAAPDAEYHDLVSIADLKPRQVENLLHLTSLMKTRPADFRAGLAGKQLVLFFEKPSLRTRLTFESAMASLGGTSFFVDQRQERLGERETLSDVAHNVERWVQGMVLRTFAHQTVVKMAEYASIPVVNALSDLEHPCQALADWFTLQEKFGDVKNIRLTYVGDGNNVCHSLLQTAAALGAKICVASPKGYEPNARVVAAAREVAQQTGGTIELINHPRKAVMNADAIYTDAWASMGQEHEANKRAVIFAPYQVNEELMSAAPEHALFMHCLPAHRGEEVTDAVIDSPQSVVFDQAENRLHIQKAILLTLLGSGKNRLPVRSAHV
jgi:ornithine carbamoyltransferase